MRSKKKRLRRNVKAEAMAGLRPISAADLIELLKGAEGLEAVRANRAMDILPHAPTLFQIDQSPEARAHYDAIDEGLRAKP